MRRFGLRYQLTWWFLLIGVVPAVGGSLYTYTVTRSSLYREATSVMRGEAVAVSDRLDEALRIAQSQLVLAAVQIAARMADRPQTDLKSAASLLQSWGSRAPVSLDAWSVLDDTGALQVLLVDGRPVVGAVTEADRVLAASTRMRAEGEVVFGGLVMSSRTGRPALSYATPIRDPAGSPIGSLHGDIPVESLRRAMGVSTLHEAAYWVIDAEGRVVLTTDPRGSAGGAAPSFHAAAGDAVTVAQEAGGELSVAARSLRVSPDGPAWTVEVAVPHASIYANTGFSQYIALIAGMAATVIFFAYLVSARITRPIRQLEEGTRRIAQGELDLELKIQARNELEQLAQSFHQMAFELKRAQERLIKTERLAAIGEVSLAIHHEINNPLTSVMGFAEILQQRTDVPQEVRDQLAPIYEGAVRMRDIIKKLERVQDRTTDRFHGAKMTDLSGPHTAEGEPGRVA